VTLNDTEIDPDVQTVEQVASLKYLIYKTNANRLFNTDHVTKEMEKSVHLYYALPPYLADSSLSRSILLSFCCCPPPL
jgi:hypothetical protein